MIVPQQSPAHLIPDLNWISTNVPSEHRLNFTVLEISSGFLSTLKQKQIPTLNYSKFFWFFLLCVATTDQVKAA